MGGSISSRLRQFVGLGGRRSAAFECRGCGAEYEKDRQQCPDCDGFDIRRT